MKQFEVYVADLSPVIGSEQGGLKPVAIIQNMITDDTDKIICAVTTVNNNMSNDISIEVKTE